MKKNIFLIIVLFNMLSATAQDSVYRRLELPAAKIQSTQIIEGQQLFCPFINLNGNTVGTRGNTGVDLPHLLNQVESVVISSDAGTGIGYTNIRLRGSDLTRINVNMNGVPINDAEGQGVFFVNFPDIISGANSISVEKGIGSSRSGYGNFGGAISINNLDVTDKQAGILFQTDFGSFNTLRNTLKANTGLLNNKLISSLRLSRIVSDGYVDRSASNLNSVQLSSKFIINPSSSFIFNYLSGKEKTQQAWNGVWEGYLDTARTFNELGDKGDGTFYDNQTDNYQQDYYQLFYDNDLNKNWNTGAVLFYTKGRGYYEEYKRGQSYSNYGLAPFIQGNDTSSNTDLIRQLWLDNDFFGGKSYITYTKKKIEANLTLNYSRYNGRHFGDVIWAEKGIPNDYRWYQLTAYKQEFSSVGMFVAKPSNKVQLYADVQMRSVQYTMNGFRDYPNIQHHLNWTFFNPKVEFRYTPNANNVYNLHIARAEKEPNRNDFEAGGNQLPKTEKLVNAEFNYVHAFSSAFKINATLFYMQYQDQLVLNGQLNDVGAYTRINIPNSFRRGIELSSQYRFGTKLKVNANVALSQNKIAAFTEYVDDYDNGGQLSTAYTNTDISFSPNVIAGASLSYFPFVYAHERMGPIRQLSIDILPKYVSKQYLDNTQNNNKRLNAFTTTDVIINCPISFRKNGKLNLRTALYNVFDSLYESNGYTYSYQYGGLQTFNYYYPQAGFRWMLGVGLEL